MYWKPLRYSLTLLVFFTLGCENPLGSDDSKSTDFDPAISDGTGSGTDTEAPTVPAGLTYSGLGTATTTKTLSWTASSDNIGVSYYEVALGTTGTGLGINDLVDWTIVSSATSYQFTTTGLASNTNYYISVRAVDAAANKSSIATLSYSYFDPSDFSNLVMWLDMQDASTLFSNTGCSSSASTSGILDCITDKSGNSNTFTTDAGAPTYSAASINGYNALNLPDGARLETPNSTLINDGDRDKKTHYIVFATDSDVTTRQELFKEGGGTNGTAFYIEGGLVYIGAWIDGSGNAGDRAWLSFSVSANSNYIAGFTFDDTIDSFTASVNGVALTTAALGGQRLKSHTGNIVLGAGDTSIRLVDGSNVTIAATVPLTGEHIMYDDALSTANQELLEGYLACKWGLQSTLPGTHTYTSTCP